MGKEGNGGGRSFFFHNGGRLFFIFSSLESERLTRGSLRISKEVPMSRVAKEGVDHSKFMFY